MRYILCLVLIVGLSSCDKEVNRQCDPIPLLNVNVDVDWKCYPVYTIYLAEPADFGYFNIRLKAGESIDWAVTNQGSYWEYIGQPLVIEVENGSNYTIQGTFINACGESRSYRTGFDIGEDPGKAGFIFQAQDGFKTNQKIEVISRANISRSEWLLERPDGSSAQLLPEDPERTFYVYFFPEEAGIYNVTQYAYCVDLTLPSDTLTLEAEIF